MKTAFVQSAIGIGIALAIFFSGMAFAQVGLQLSVNPGDAATWAGAALAGMAFAGTIWVATSERRERKRREVSRARILCSLLYIRLALLRKSYQSAIDVLNAANDINNACNILLPRISKLDLVSVDEISDIECVPQNVSIAAARLVSINSAAMFAVEIGAGLRDVARLDTARRSAIDILNTGILQINRIQPTLKSFADDEAPIE